MSTKSEAFKQQIREGTAANGAKRPFPCGLTWGSRFASLAGQRSRRQLRTRVSSDHLRRLSKGAQEGAAHAVAIDETRLPGDDVDRVAALLHHQAGGLDAKVLDRLGGRLAGLGAKRTAELTRA